MATKKTETKEKKATTKKKVTTKKTTTTKKTVTKKTPKKIEEPVEEINLVGATEEKVLETFENIKEDDTIFVVGDKKEVKQEVIEPIEEPTVPTPIEEPTTEETIKVEFEVVNGDPAVIAPKEEEKKFSETFRKVKPYVKREEEKEEKVVEKKENKFKKLIRRTNQQFGYFWNGQMIDF